MNIRLQSVRPSSKGVASVKENEKLSTEFDQNRIGRGNQ